MKRPPRRFKLPEHEPPKKMRLEPEEITGDRLALMAAIMDHLGDSEEKSKDVLQSMDEIFKVLDVEFRRITDKYTKCATPLAHLILLAIGTRMAGWDVDVRVQLIQTFGTAIMGIKPGIVEQDISTDGLPN